MIRRVSMRRARILCAGIGMAMLVASCLGRSPDVRHFTLGVTLESSGSPRTSDARAPDLSVLIGPIRLPRSVDRNQIARRARSGEVELDEFNRWLGGFEENLTTALASDVRRRLGSDRVVGYPSSAPFPLDYSVRIHVDDWIVEESDQLHVALRFAISSARDEVEPLLHNHEERVDVAGSSAAAIVKAHDRALSALAQRIADALVEVSSSP